MNQNSEDNLMPQKQSHKYTDLVTQSIEKYGPPSDKLQGYERAIPSTVEFHIRSGYIICNVLFGGTWRTSSWRDSISIIDFLMSGQMNKAQEWPVGRDFEAMGGSNE